MGLYPNILFHFTNKQSLFGILSSTFKPSYSREYIEGTKEKKEFAVPMVSFCDLRLSELKDHIEKYGTYGIGLTKNWAIEKGLNPVIYVNKNSHFIDNLINGIGEIFRYINKIVDEDDLNSLSTAYMNILNTYRFIKNYEGLLKQKGKTIPNYRYADEREWRFVPPIETEIDYRPFVPLNRISTKEKKEQLNAKIEHRRLTFKPDDIKYLIVQSDSEINEIINHLRSVKNRFKPKVIDRLTSRILTSEQIESDI